MPDVRLAVCRGGTVVKGKFFGVFVFFDALFKDFVFLPEFDYFLFAFDEIKLSVNFFIHFELLWNKGFNFSLCEVFMRFILKVSPRRR